MDNVLEQAKANLAIHEAKAAIEAVLAEIGQKHGVDFQWQVQFPPVVNALMQQMGVMQIQSPSIELIATPLADKPPIQLDGFFPEAAPKEELGT